MFRTLFDVDRRVITVAVARMAESVGNSFLVIVIPLYIASDVVTGDFFGLSNVAVTGIILSLFGFVNSPLQPFTGRMSDRTGRRRVFILFGLALLAVASFTYTFADSYTDLVVLRVLQGVAGAFIIPSAVALVNDYVTVDNRGGNMGLYNTFRLVGFGLGPIAAGAVIAGGPYVVGGRSLSLEVSGFDAAFYFAAAMAATSLVLVLALVRDPSELQANATKGFGIQVFDRSDDRMFDPIFAIALATFFVAVAIGLFATLQDPVNRRLDQTPAMFGVQFAAFILAQVALQLPIGRGSDLYGRRPFILTGLALMVPTTFVQGVILDSWLMVFARVIQGVGGALVFVVGLSMAGDLAREGEAGAQLSIVTMGFVLGLAFGPLLSGFLVAYGFVVPFAFGAVLAAIGLVLIYTNVEETVAKPRPLPFTR